MSKRNPGPVKILAMATQALYATGFRGLGTKVADVALEYIAMRDTLKAGYELAHPLWAIGGHQERVAKWNAAMDSGYTLIGVIKRCCWGFFWVHPHTL